MTDNVSVRYKERGMHMAKKQNETNQELVRLQDFLDAEERAVMEKARYMKSLNTSEEDDRRLSIVIHFILDVTTRMQELLFGESEEAYIKLFNEDFARFKAYELDGKPVFIIDEYEES